MTSSHSSRERVPHVLLVCSGLDHAHRGFESFARECFDALHDVREVRLELVKGSGRSGPDERSVPTLRRDRALARVLGHALDVRPFRIEAFAFGFALAPLIARRRPDVVYLSEWDTARALARLRSLKRLPFKILLCNGTLAATGFEHLDHVQELTPPNRDWVLARGANPRKHSMLPLGVQIQPELTLLPPAKRLALRQRLRLPTDRQILLSVAALNRTDKRLDYLIEEVAALPRPRPFVLFAGQPDADTPAVRSLARQRLGEANFTIRTVPSAEIPALYRVCDRFALVSLVEAQGRVLIEAMSHGMPCLAHDSSVMRFALGEYGIFGDFTQRGALTRLLAENPSIDLEAARARHRHVYERFSWDCLRPCYVELLRRVASANSTVSSSTGENVPR